MSRPRPPWLLVGLIALTVVGCGGGVAERRGAGEPTIPTTTTVPTAIAEAEVQDRVWEGRAFDLFGVVRLEATAPEGVPRRATVYDDGEEVGAGNLVAWVDEVTPEPIATMAAADCDPLDAQLDRWSDVLYRLDLSEAEKAEAAAFLRFGVDRADALGCGYVVEREGRATPFP